MGHVEGERFMADIKGVREEHRRTALKTVSWRIAASSATVFLVYVFTRRLDFTIGVGVGEAILKTLIYFFHERAWDRIAFGRRIIGTVESATRTPPVKALPSETVSSVIQRMVATDIGAVIVADRDKPCGLITEKDVLERVLQAGEDPSTTPAEDIMSSPVATVEYDVPLTHVLMMMREQQIRRLAVTRDGKLSGIVTERRILEALI